MPQARGTVSRTRMPSVLWLIVLFCNSSSGNTAGRNFVNVSSSTTLSVSNLDNEIENVLHLRWLQKCRCRTAEVHENAAEGDREQFIIAKPATAAAVRKRVITEKGFLNKGTLFQHGYLMLLRLGADTIVALFMEAVVC